MDVGSNAEDFVRSWRETRLKNGLEKASVWPVLLKTYGPAMLATFFVSLIHHSLNFVNPQLLRLLVRHVNDPKEEAWKGSVLLYCTGHTP